MLRDNYLAEVLSLNTIKIETYDSNNPNGTKTGFYFNFLLKMYFKIMKNLGNVIKSSELLALEYILKTSTNYFEKDIVKQLEKHYE